MSTVIVVAWSTNDYGRAAVSAALEEARLRDGTLVVVNATRGDALVDDRFAGRKQLEELEQLLAGSGLPHEIRQSMGEDVADQVLKVADQTSASLIVVGVRRRSPVGKLIMGSVAQRVIIGAACPVLAVKP